MLLRRITKHVKDQNWTAVSIDFIIVVVGVFIGIQVSNWNESRTEQVLEREYHELLAGDLKAIETTFIAQLDHEKAITDAAGIALKLINNREQHSNPLLIGQILMKLWGRRTLTLDSPTFNELKAAGRLTIIRNTLLRKQLIAYFEKLNRTERISEKNNDFFVEPFTEFLRDTGIGFVKMTEKQCPPNDESSQCFYNNALINVTQDQRTHGAELLLNAQQDDFFWAKLRGQITYRTIAAMSTCNTTIALQQTRHVIAILDGSAKLP